MACQNAGHIQKSQNNTQNIKYKSQRDVKYQSYKGDTDYGIINELSR